MNSKMRLRFLKSYFKLKSYFLLRGIFFGRYVQLKNSFSDEQNISGEI